MAIVVFALVFFFKVFGVSYILLMLASLFLGFLGMVTGKETDEVIKDVKEKLEEKYEGKKLNLFEQIVALARVAIIAFDHRFSRLVLGLVTGLFVGILLFFGPIATLVLLILMLLGLFIPIAAYLYNNIEEIEAQPPHVALLLVLGYPCCLFYEGLTIIGPHLHKACHLSLIHKCIGPSPGTCIHE